MRLEVPLEDGTSIFLESGPVPDYEPEETTEEELDEMMEKGEPVQIVTEPVRSGPTYHSDINSQVAINTAVTAAIIAANAAIF